MNDTDATSSTTTVEKDFSTPKVKNFFAPLKTKAMRQMQTAIENAKQDELRPDLCIGNVLACDTNKVATIRRPYQPLKYPISQQHSHDYANVICPMPYAPVSSFIFQCLPFFRANIFFPHLT